MTDNLRVLLQLSLRLDVPYTLLVYSDYILFNYSTSFGDTVNV